MDLQVVAPRLVYEHTCRCGARGSQSRTHFLKRAYIIVQFAACYFKRGRRGHGRVGRIGHISANLELITY